MTIIEVDDGDARIMYSYGWSRGGSPPDLNHTISYTSTQGAQFTFVFLGTSVRVFGTLAATTFPNTSYSIDSGEPVLFFGEPPAQMQYRRNFFSSPDLKYGTHTLVGTCVDEGGLVYLDYLEVETPALLITSGSASSQPLPSLPTKSQSSLSGLSSTDSPTSGSPTGLIVSTISPLSSVIITYWGSQPSEVSAASPSIFKSKPTPSAAAIIGGVVGGFALAVITRVLYLRYRRWKSRKLVALIPRRQSFSSLTSLAGSA
ncbi:hypothetical protein PC9H_009929 [Pleurotus ostreatus]|uniref:Uncharacterized protein n=1 Tax=Pleurotus ostreatus TaxID=5322 RepID=A0A8H6ZRL5_PLEOS|nr:uncharacterized protein PC9H_009929 [Pleurotus ostreatus]KAF7424621.1 hypothetical protein PC9H_009929 [Pleurotus ostreatus]